MSEFSDAPEPNARGVLARIDAGWAWLANFGARSMALWGVLSVSLGATAFWWFNEELRKPLLKNQLPEEFEKSGVLAYLIGAGLLVALLPLLHVFWRRRRGTLTRSWEEGLASSLRGLLGLLLLPLYVVLATPKLEQSERLLCAGLCVVFGLVVLAWVRALPARALERWLGPDRNDAQGKLRDRLAWLGVLGLFFAYAWTFSGISLTNLWAFNMKATDLGNYDQVFYQSSHGNFLGCTYQKGGYHGSAHFDPLLALLSPLYLLYPRVEFILVLQSVWLASGVVFVYLLGRHFTGARLAGLAFATMWTLYPALHGTNLYEFHSLTLASPILLALVYAMERAYMKRYYLALALAMLTREDIPLVVCFVGLYGLMHPGEEAGRKRAGWVTIVLALIYFVLTKKVFMAAEGVFVADKAGYSYAYYYKGVMPEGEGMLGLLFTLVSNPAFVLRHISSPEKLFYLAVIFGPFFFLPFVVERGRWLLVYGLTFILLSSNGAVFSPHFQYSATLLPFAFALAPAGVARLVAKREAVEGPEAGLRLRRALVWGMLATTVCFSWKFGAIVENASFKGGFRPLEREVTEKHEKVHAWLDEQVRSLPIDATLAVSQRAGAQLSNRPYIVHYPKKRDTEYVVVYEGDLQKSKRKAYQKEKREERLEEMSREGRWVLYRRRSEEERKLALEKRKPSAKRASRRAPKRSEAKSKAKATNTEPAAEPAR